MTRPVSICFEGEIVQLPRLQHSWHISSSLRPVLQGRRASCHHHCDGHGYDHYIFQLPFHFCQLLCKFTVCVTKLHVHQVCIRREEGYCKIGWIQTSDTDSFKLSRPSTNYKVYFCISKIVIFHLLGRHPVWQWLRQRLHKVTQNIRKDQKDHDYY